MLKESGLWEDIGTLLDTDSALFEDDNSETTGGFKISLLSEGGLVGVGFNCHENVLQSDVLQHCLDTLFLFSSTHVSEHPCLSLTTEPFNANLCSR